MRTTSLFSRISMIVSTIALILVAAGFNAHASTTGTRAGTTITSNASAAYNDKNGSAMTPVSQSVSIYVALKPASSIAITQSNLESYDGSFVTYTITVTNNSNGADRYAMEPIVTGGSAYLDSIGWYKDAGLSQPFAGAGKNIMLDTVSAEVGSNTATVYAKVYLKADGAPPSFDNQNIAVDFRSRSTANNSDTTYPTLDNSSVIAVSPLYLNAISATVTRTTRVKESVFALTTTSNTSANRPGTTVSYSFSLANSGHGGAQSMTVRVDYPSDLTFSSGTNWTDNGTYATYVVANANLVAGHTFSLPSSDSLKLGVANLASVLEGSTRTPTQSVSYQDTTGTARTRLNSSSDPTTTILFKAFAPTIATTLADTTVSGDPGDSVTVIYMITNNSNGPDAYHVRYTTASQEPDSFSFVYYYDINGNNTFDAGTDSLFLAGGLDSHATKLIAKGASITVFLRTKVPSGLTITPVHVVNLASSYRDSATTGDFNLWSQITANIPSIQISRSRVINTADSAGTPGSAQVIPGGLVEYYIYVSNTGTGQASTVIISDDLINNSSITRRDTVVIRDNAGVEHVITPITGSNNGDATTYGAVKTGGGGYIITINTLPAGEVRRIRYRVTVN